MVAMTALNVDSAFGGVILVVVGMALVNAWMSVQVGQARKKYGVRYPAMYADEEKNKEGQIFNCIQRGHQNTLEQLPVFFSLLILGGLKAPLLAATLGALFVIGRVLYFLGYSTGDPKKRMRGGVFVLALLGLVALNIYTGVVMMVY